MLDGRRIATQSSWDRSKQLSRHERGYGYAWEKLRKSILLRDSYLCQPCLRRGIPEPAKQVDHIVPKSQGGTDDHENLQSICEPCHKEKTLIESIGGFIPEIGGGGASREMAKNLEATFVFSGIKGGSYMPEWLPKPRIPVLVVCGPPGAGKTTYVRENAGKNDLVLDLDEISARLSGKAVYTTDRRDSFRGLKYRNAMLAGLASRSVAYDRCWLIVTGRNKKQREWWKDKLCAEVIIIQTTKEECRRRILSDGRRPEAVKTRHLDVIEDFEF